MSERLLPALWTLGALAAWLVLAARNPDLTYHFAPLVAAAAWPIASRRAVTAIVSGALTTAVGAGLWLTDSLEGPDFFGGHAAFAEAIVFAACGAALGAAWAVARSPAPRADHVS